eukprot:1383491-Amphidinium_carterae.1
MEESSSQCPSAPHPRTPFTTAKVVKMSAVATPFLELLVQFLCTCHVILLHPPCKDLQKI